MDAHHGQEGQQRRGCRHREHIAEIGACRHFNVLDQVGVDLAALDDALFQYHQIFFQQDDICQLLGHIHSGSPLQHGGCASCSAAWLKGYVVYANLYGGQGAS